MKWQKMIWTLLLLLTCFSGAEAGECQKPILEDNMLLTDEAIMKNEFPDGSTISLECANGFDQVPSSEIITCKDGQWSKPDLICKKKDCGYPESSPNLEYHIPNGTLFGSSIKPFCKPGYFLQGSSYRQCLVHGWSGRSFCVEKDCGYPESSPNLEYHIPNGTLFGSSIKPFCKPGYFLHGSSYRQCLVHGWSGRSFCVAITCGHPPEIPHAKTDKPHNMIHTFGAIINYICDPSYTLVGNDTIICQETGNFSSPLPQCIDTSATTIGPENTVTSSTNFTTQYFQDSTDNIGFGIVIGIVILIIVCVFFVPVIVLQHNKRKGSYETGEDQRKKEELIQKSIV
ncbi:complement decay-accelerating factor, GPI-anchored isoform X2 [Trichomycterus rosablanca]|uniref:complement decay-accelerating factor, GPI-anchored isoform X2 n=1 Tax=Trichomycterus rosablanca TaxID=2290929 RepID=UPI002F35EB17